MAILRRFELYYRFKAWVEDLEEENDPMYEEMSGYNLDAYEGKVLGGVLYVLLHLLPFNHLAQATT